MFFFLRCIFWLGLVFWHLDWTTPADAGRSAAAAPRVPVAHAERPSPNSVAPMLQDLARQAGAKAQDWCAGHPKDCIGALIGAAGTLEGLEEAKPFASPAPAAKPAPRMQGVGTRAG